MRSIRLLGAFLGLATYAAAERLPIRAYSVSEGLAHNHVNRIYRDSHDFLWICTDAGLSRFDGRTFVNYTVASGLPHIHVNDLVETRAGDYWIATDGGPVLFRVNDTTRPFTTFPVTGRPQALFTNSIAEEPDGALLVGTSAGLYRLRRTKKGASFERIDFASPPDFHESDLVNAILFDPSGNLWIGAASGLYWRSPAGEWTRFSQEHGLPHFFVGRLIIDPEGRLWACTRQGLARITREPRVGHTIVDLTVTKRDGLQVDDVRQIAFTSDGRRWLATMGGLVEWSFGELGQTRFRVHSEASGLTDRAVYALAEDPDGNLWMGTRRGGLMRLASNGFHTFSQADGLEFTSSDTILATRSGEICLAAIYDLRRTIRCFQGGRFRATFPRLPALTLRNPGYTHATMQDRRGHWWLSSRAGLFRFRGVPSDENPDLRLLPSMESWQLYEDSRGDVWVVVRHVAEGGNDVRGFGLMQWERASRHLHDYGRELPPEVREQSIDAICEGTPGEIWIGLARPGGVFRFRNKRFHLVSGIPAGRVSSLYRDRNGRIWIATSEGGLARIDAPESEMPAIRMYTTADGLSSDEIWCLVEDRVGNIYAGTARGVDRLDPTTGAVVRYSAVDGLPAGDVRAAFRDRAGDLWFLPNGGLSRLHPAASRRRNAPNVRITAIRVGGVPLALSNLGTTQFGPLRFASHRNSIEVDFSAIDYTSMDQLRYQFLLDTDGARWSNPVTNPTAHFANLAPGRYRFLVRAVSSEAPGKAVPASFDFTVDPPLRRRWWFQAVLAIAGVIVAYLLHRYHLTRQLALERVRSRIATDLHDDIGASLSRIAIMSEALKDQVGAAGSKPRKALAEIAETSRNLMEDMSDIVWSIDPRRDTLRDVVVRLRAFGSDVLEPRGIQWAFEAPDDALSHKLSPDQRRQLYLFFKEAINNIARHSRASHAALRMGLDRGHIFAEIVDDGYGFCPDGKLGLGIHSMRWRGEQLGGEVELPKCQGDGARVALRFPLKNA